MAGPEPGDRVHVVYYATVGSLAGDLPLVPLVRDDGLWLELPSAVTVTEYQKLYLNQHGEPSDEVKVPDEVEAKTTEPMRMRDLPGLPRQVVAARKTVIIAIVAVLIILTIMSVELGIHGLGFFIQRPPNVGCKDACSINVG